MIRNVSLFLVLFCLIKLNFAQVVINEFLASNDAGITDEYGEYDDWIELYNAGNDTVDIGGYYITDDSSDTTQFQIPTGNDSTKIAPGQFLLLWADKESEQGVLHVEIKLSANGEEIFLYEPDGTTLVDSITFGAQATDVSYGRSIDGGTSWETFANPTPAASNSPANAIIEAKYSRIVCFPNPCYNVLNFKNIDQNTIVKIYNIAGMCIKEQQLQNTQTIDVSRFTKGLYIYQIVVENNIFATGKFSKL